MRVQKLTGGPRVRNSQRKTLSVQVEDAKSKEGKILTGGNSVDGEGYFYEPTIVSDVRHNMKISEKKSLVPRPQS